MASNEPEPLTERTQKRKASDTEEDEKASSDNETPSSSKAILHQRKRSAPSSLESDYTSWSESGDEANSSSWSESGDEADSSCLKSPLSGKERGNDSASQWTYKDLMHLNIFYEEKPEPLEKFLIEVKDAFMNEKGFCPDPSKITSSFKKQLEEILTFSYDLKKIRKILRVPHKTMEAQKVEEEIKKSIQKTWEMPEKVLFDKQTLESPVGKFAEMYAVQLNSALMTFARETDHLINLVLYEEPESMYPSQTCETDKMSASKEEQKGRGRGKRRRGRAGGGKEGPQDHQEDSKCGQTTESIFENFCKFFGNVFFLQEGYIPQRSFSFQNKKLKNVPNLVYHFYSGKKDQAKDIVLFVEVKKAPVTEDATDIRQLVGQNVMGQFGAELLGQSLHSVFYPNSLGILCMETKLIFAFLKISDEHATGICLGDRGTADDQGKVIYTEPFDMLKAEDRLKIADFLFWLGIVQDSNKFSFF
ncbi:uncharacterized protein LOC133194595 [Saccostrea echinata]|uniref:uncharacterized protein LOC133194595 n=1 Tax=Saccostrea echinata TaxID=191078 RepID=UPI002A82D70D|nr:uncharacterized protein LOC133194595 [Saccostrea echinata]